jgi:curli biogenesis system outer membrane secretion channel CsgG
MNTRHPSLPLLLVLAGACASTSQSAGRDSLTAMVGLYPPPPPDLQRVRVGVPQFQANEGIEPKLTVLAADQASTLAANTQRFDVVERAQLGQLLQEQGLEGIVVGSELAQAAQVRGVDWLLLGKVTSLRVKQDRTGSSFDFGNVPLPGTSGMLGIFGVENQDTVLKVECGVDLRLVDPATGLTVAADFSEFDRTDAASAMGLQILGGNAQGQADVQVSEDDMGRILRLAIDDCLRKLLPKVDRAMQQRQAAAQPAVAAAASAPAAAPPAAAAFCSQCGTRQGAGAKFCAGCGAAVR